MTEQFLGFTRDYPRPRINCTECNNELVLKWGNKKIPHFSHFNKGKIKCNFNKETLYDFRVYAKNENSIRPNKYLYFNSLKTLISNPPDPPQNISITKNNNNPSNSINISWDHSISENLPIYKYNINWNSIESIKYPNYIQDNSNLITTSLSIFNNANNFITGQNLYPGHKYNVNIQSKNILNDTYGLFSYYNTDIITTDYPISPNYINSYNINILNKNNYLFNINQGYSLDGNTIIQNIFNNLLLYIFA